MKTFKIIDCGVQALLIIGGILIFLLGLASYFNFDGGFVMYFIVGSWQIMSLFVHFFAPTEYKVGLRKVYSILLLITALTLLIGFLNTDLLTDMLFGLLLWSPILAIIYLITCVLELKKMNARAS